MLRGVDPSPPLPRISRAALVRCAPFALFIVLLALQPLIERAAGIDARYLVLGRNAAVALLLALLWGEYREVHAAPRLGARDAALAVATGLLVFIAWIALDVPWATLGERGRGFEPLTAGRIDWLLALARLAALALIVPPMEELFWRSYVVRRIDAPDFLRHDPRSTSRIAFALSCALFASEHAMWLAGLAAGVAYTWVYTRTANLKAPILSHATTNGTLGLWILATGQWHLW